MENVVSIVKAFHGDIFGAYVRDLYAQKHFGDKTLEARIDEHAFSYFIGVMGIFYEVTIRILHASGVLIGLRPRDGGDEAEEVDMNVTWCSPLRWSTVSPEFIDVNLLVSNGTAIFVRPDAALSFTSMTNKIDRILSRVRANRFAMYRLPVFPASNVLKTLGKCHDLVKNGWVMDDAYVKKNTAVINTWQTFKDSIDEVRAAFNEHEREALVSQDQCSLCHETFQDGDMVLNTCCNHNFHWVCNGDDRDRATRMSGVSSWFQMKRDFACPFCRQVAVSYLA